MKKRPKVCQTAASPSESSPKRAKTSDDQQPSKPESSKAGAVGEEGGPGPEQNAPEGADHGDTTNKSSTGEDPPAAAKKAKAKKPKQGKNDDDDEEAKKLLEPRLHCLAHLDWCNMTAILSF